MKQDKIFIYGRHALEEALDHNSQSLIRVFLDDKRQNDLVLINRLKSASIKISPLANQSETKDLSHHQGIIAKVSLDHLVKQYDDFIATLNVTDQTSLLVLGEIQDPHNVGAIIRSAAAFGVSGVLLPKHNQAPITGTVVKVSAGMVFKIPVVQIGNINHTLRDLKKRGFWIYGLDGAGDKSINEEDFTAPSVFVLGNEANGIREKTYSLCDIILSIPIHPRCESLNVATSTAVALFSWSNRHPNTLK